jgi:hypothetical protein
MKANELRLGNLVLNGGSNIKDITPQTISDFDNKLIVLNPILLTEEWLIKLGFIKHVNQSIWYTLNKVDVWFFDGKYVNDIDVEINFVHELQNLYFALTNEELQIKC